MARPMRMLYYFDVISPYSALSWHVLRRYRPRWNFELTLKPMFLGGVMPVMILQGTFVD